MMAPLILRGIDGLGRDGDTLLCSSADSVVVKLICWQNIELMFYRFRGGEK